MAAELRAIEGSGAGAPEPDAVTFEDFWLLYPRKVAKLDAKKAWGRIEPDRHVFILTAIVAWRQVWRDKDPNYLPHASTWLNGERWDDELPQGYRMVPADTPRPAEPIVITERVPIPAHVKALMAKLRAR